MNENLKIEQVVQRVNDANGKRLGYLIYCPACETGHLFDDRWTFNNNYERPTFSPSMHVNASTTEKTCNVNRHRCHSFVTDGYIKYLGDCTHDKKNQTIKLEVF